MLFEIISILIIVDSFIAMLIGYTKLGDTTIEQWGIFKRYLPLNKAWSAVYFVLALYIGYLTFFVM